VSVAPVQLGIIAEIIITILTDASATIIIKIIIIWTSNHLDALTFFVLIVPDETFFAIQRQSTANTVFRVGEHVVLLGSGLTNESRTIKVLVLSARRISLV
jgi:hypothetical protein